MTLSTLSALPAAPTRADSSTFDDRADAFLTALVTLQEETNDWISEFNAESNTFDGKFYSSDSRLSSLESEVDDARAGSETVGGRITALSDQIANLITLQKTLSLGEISVSMSRRPTPDDDGYVVGTYWVYPDEDDCWFCVRVLNQRARWRRSNGDLIRRLEAPTVIGDTSIDTAGDLTVSLTGLDSEATEVRWTATGSPTVAAGAMAGTLGTSITLSWAAAGNYEVRARVYGDGNQLLYDSLYSDALPVIVGPSLYCGCGAYCGDGSYCGMMLS